MSDEVEVFGIQDVEQKLRDLGPKLAKKALVASLKAGGEVLREALEENAPVGPPTDPHSGQLAESMEMVVSLVILDNEGMISVGPDKDAFWGRFSEFGTVNEPARPWMRPAFDQAKYEALDKFTAEMAAHIPDLVEE
jgi:HK97 gp10 family phage protein